MSGLKNVKISKFTYKDEIPSTGDKVTLTPFRVGDEKVLMEAMQSEDALHMQNAVKNVISNCVDPIDVDALAPYDIEYLFLKLRVKSVGEEAEIGIKCDGCEEFNKIPVNLETVKVVKNENHQPMVRIQDDLAFEMQYPEVTESVKEQTETEALFKVICSSVKRVYYGEDVIDVGPSEMGDLQTLIEELSQEQFLKIQEFFETVPKLTKTVDFVCGSCAKENTYKLEGLKSFLS